MALAATHTSTVTGPVNVLKIVWDALVRVGENSSRARISRQISEMTDAEVEATGMSREDLVRRAFGSSFYI